MSNPYESLKERFWSKVDIKGADECWNWLGALKDRRRSNGMYGSFRVSKTKTDGAHRVSFVLTNGEIQNGLFVCHSCDNTLCCNPSHLWLGTNGENMADAFRKKRKSTPSNQGERHGMSILSAEQARAIKRAPRTRGSGVALAKEFGVSQQTIALIRNGTRWAHIS